MSYIRDVPRINAAMRACPDTFARGIMFAIVSARVPFVRVSEQMKELDSKGRAASCLWGWKRDAFDYVSEHKETLWREVCGATCSREALAILCRVPGLGIVKAAFVLQFLGHDVACLDTRNVKREGRNPRAFRSDGEARKSKPAFRRKIERYVAETEGKAQHYWNAWCEDLGNETGLGLGRVSAAHVFAIVPRSLRHLPPVMPMGMSEIPF